MRKRQKRLPNLAQENLAFALPEVPETPRPAGAEGRFVDDSPYHLRIGAQRLDEYLRSHRMQWVLGLRAALERLDYASMLVAYHGTGRPPFHPRTLLGLIIYGILNRSWSLRDLESLAARDVGAWWITGGHQPDHSTIGEFVNRHAGVLSEEFFRTVLGEIVARLKLSPGVVAGDGTVIEAAASHYRTLRQEAAELEAQRARERAMRAPQDDELAAAAMESEKIAALAKERSDQRKQKGRPSEHTQVSPREPEAVLQPRKDGAMRLAYKPSLLVHETGLIVGQALHASSETAVVGKLLEQHQAVFDDKPLSLLLDAAYCTGELLQELAERELDVLCPAGKAKGEDDWEKSGARGLFGKSAFAYDAERNAYRCPAGQWLHQFEQSRDGAGRAYRRYRSAACGQCRLRGDCTQARTGRTLKRYAGEEYREAMAQVLRQPRARQRYRRRAAIAERPFAEFRERHDLRRFHRRGSSGAAVEFSLHCIAFNLKWALGSDAFRINGLLITARCQTPRGAFPISIVLLWPGL